MQQGISNHIISKFRWDTTFDRKEKASELQERLSAWSRMSMQKEIMDIFDKVCPPEQTWKIDLLELNLGRVNYNDLEFELALKLRQMLNEMLIDLIIYANKTGRSNIEILNEDASQISLLRSYLLEGIMPWNYKPAGGSVNEMMTYQLQYNRRRLIEMLRETGGAHENVRKRIAWQISDPSIIKIIEGLEPNNHTQIIDFSSEMTRIQMKETVVQASTMDFKKNLWLWILNYLLTERGTIFSKVAFMRSSITQMAMYYNIAYDELFELIERAVESISKVSGVKSDFILTLQMLSKEKRPSKNKKAVHAESNEFYSGRLRSLFQNRSLRTSGALKAEFNELVCGLFREDRRAFRQLILSFGDSEELWAQAINDLNDAALEAIVAALSPVSAAMIIEHVYFLHRLGKKLNPAIRRKAIWKTAVKFLLVQKTVAFSSSTFLHYCITALSKKNKMLKPYLVDQLMNAKINASAKTVSTMDLYAELGTIFIEELNAGTTDFFEDNFKELIAMFERQLSASAIDKELFIALKRSLQRNLQLQPHQSLTALMNYSSKETIRKILPYLLNDYSVRLLMKHVKKETVGLISAIQQTVTELKTVERSATLAQAISGELFVAATEIVILRPALTPFRFLEAMLEVLYERGGASEAVQFSIFTELLLRDEQTASIGISKAEANQLIKKYMFAEKQPVAERVALLIAASENNRTETAKELRNKFSVKDTEEIKKLPEQQSDALLDYLLPEGKQLMQSLIKKYSALLLAQEIHLSEKELVRQLKTLYWKCILDHSAHKGEKEKLERAFKAGLMYTFSINGKEIAVAKTWNHQATGQEIKQSTKEKTYRLKNGTSLSQAMLIELVREGFANRTEIIQGEQTGFEMKELLHLLLKTNPAGLRRLLSEDTVHTEQHLSVLKSTLSFEAFSRHVMNGSNAAIAESLQSMQLLQELFAHIAPAQLVEELMNNCWQLSLKLIQTGSNAATQETGKMIAEWMQQLALEKEINTTIIVSAMNENNIQVTPAFHKLIEEIVPGFSTVGLNETVDAIPAALQKAEQKKLLEELLVQLISHEQIPAWFENATEQKPELLLNEIVIYYPETFLVVITQQAITEPQFSRLHQSLDFSALVRSAGKLNKNKQAALSIFEGLYHSMGRIVVKGIAAKEIQYLLFRKLLKAWTSGNWRIISTEQIWNELSWDICVKRGVARKDLASGIEKIRNTFPVALQVALEQMKDRERTAAVTTAVAAVKAIQQKPVLPQLKTNAVKTAKGGIPVKNAGIVLISSYVEMLLERLGLTEAKKFKDHNAAMDAPHFLQYVVTGLSATEESLLPLNKVLCGLPLPEPLREGITITDEQHKLIEGLLKAMIGYWPAIGNCSVEGFRGNWLVREGLLLEHDDKWELTVEKKAYDVLIHQSPFSFSIIKLPWMSKPLHVTWPY